MKGETPKRKSHNRWEQFNRIVDDIACKLPTASHVAVLMVCFRHGRGAGFFRVSTGRIAESVKLKERRVKYILDELETAGIITLIKEHQGPIPRTYRIIFGPC